MACQLTCNIIWLVVSFWFSIHRNGWSVMIIPTGMFFHAFRKCLETSSHFLFKSAPTFRSSPLAGEEDGRSICSRLLFYRWCCCAVRVTASQCHSVTAVSMTGCHSQNGQSWTERRKKLAHHGTKQWIFPKYQSTGVEIRCIKGSSKLLGPSKDWKDDLWRFSWCSLTPADFLGVNL